MDEEMRKMFEEKYEELFYNEGALERRQAEYIKQKEALDEQENELTERKKQLQDKWAKLSRDMTETERRWDELKPRLDEALYSEFGFITMLHDGCSGPFEEEAEQLKALCAEARTIIQEQGYADIAQFDYCVAMLSLMSNWIYERTQDWLPKFIDELSDLLLSDA